MNKEGEDLWFNLLELIYKYEEECEKSEIKLEETNEILKNSEYRQQRVQSTLQKCIEDLLKQMCLFVSVKNLVEYVTENQNRAQYKEFKFILESMLRTNTSFDRIINSTMNILKKSILNSENQRKKIILHGNNYNYKKCDVCHKPFENIKGETMICFGCGHQSHKDCCYKNKNLKKEELVGLENKYKPECFLCHQIEVEKEKNEDRMINKDDKDEKVKDDIVDDLEEAAEKLKKFKFGNKKEKFKKMLRYEKSYLDQMSMFY